MGTATLEEIRTHALDAHEQGISWHFHIMTPTCKFNKLSEYAFILEIPDDKVALVHYSDKAEKGLGQELAPLLHGSDVLDTSSSSDEYSPSAAIQEIVRRAEELNEQHIEWHHHMFFPNCRFNNYPDQHLLVFEDPRVVEPFESATATEPTDDLKQIENMFYASRS